MRPSQVADQLGILRRARDAGRVLLAEAEGFALCESLGIAAPRRLYVDDPGGAATLDLDTFPGDRLVIKVDAAEIAHKTDVGGVRVCARKPEAARLAIEEMGRKFDGQRIGIHEFIRHDREPGGELLLGIRHTPDFGPVVTLGLGGADAERLALWEPLCQGSFGSFGERLPRALAGSDLARFLTEKFRGRPPRITVERLSTLLRTVLEAAGALMPPLLEFEINPLIAVGGRLVALDVLARLGEAEGVGKAPRPVHKLGRLLEPRSIAVAGVSRRQNPGRVILENILAEGFPKEQVTVVKPGVEEVDGCRAVASVTELPATVDLLVLAIDAGQVPQIVEQAVDGGKAESIILIPGGLGERPGSETQAERIETAIARARATKWQGPLVNGGNCLGVRSRPGSYDTLFIPRYKLPLGNRQEAPLALISQSGAFAVATTSRLWSLGPRYVISVGNQIDLTVGDYLTYLADDPAIRVFSCYVEGFRPLDGVRFLAAAEKITASGRPVVLYRAGRTAAGVEAAVSHTAAIAGSYSVTRQLATQAGVLVADTLDEFEELTRTLCLLDGRETGGIRLGAMSNAGFESVAMADRLGRLELAELSASTSERLSRLIVRQRLETVVAVGNPLDTSPIFDDESFTEAAAIVLDDGNVDVGLIGCVPLTPALQTLDARDAHGEDLSAESSVGTRLARLWIATSKPWAVVVDAGPLYDGMARKLEGAGIPTFRTADRALRVLDACCAWRRDHR